MQCLNWKYCLRPGASLFPILLDRLANRQQAIVTEGVGIVTLGRPGKDWQSSCRKRENGWESTSWQLGLVPIHLLAPHRIEYQYSNNIINSARISTNTSTSTITSTSINTSTKESCKIGLVLIHPSTTQTPSLLGARLPPQRTDAPK